MVVTRLQPPSAYWSEPDVVRALAVPQLLAAALLVASMPLVWHHRTNPGAGYTLVRGIDGANWLLVIAAIALFFGVRFLLSPPGFWTPWWLSIASLVLLIGMFADYIDWEDNAAFYYVGAYFGPGFFVALGGTAVFVAATVLAWFRRG